MKTSHGKNKRRNLRSRTILSLLLASLLAAEPSGAAMTVYAVENVGITAQTAAGLDQESEDAQESQETGNASETGGNQNGQGADAGNEGTDSENAGGAGIGAGNTEGENGVPGSKDTEGENGAPDSKDTEGESADPDSENTEGKNDDPTAGNADGETEETGSGNTEDEGTDSEEPEDGEEEDAENSEDLEDSEETEDETEDLEDTDDTAEEAEDSEDAFTPMPSNYRLTSAQMADKRDLAAHLNEVSGYREGVDYVEGQVITFAETQAEADQIARAFHAQIAAYEYGVLTLELDEESSVNEAMRAAADAEINLPAVWPNYYRYTYVENMGDETAPSDGADDAQLQDGLTESPSAQDDSIEVVTEEYEIEEETGELAQQEDSYLDALAYSDPYLKPSNSLYQYHHMVIGSPYAWAAGYTGKGIKVAVLDTGVASHADVSATSIFGSGTSDSVGHGTHVAGIIGARANGSLGVGVAPEVTLYSGNVLPGGNGTDDDIIKGIKAAQAKRVDIINMSLGGVGYNGAFQKVVNEAYAQGIAIFAASGNDGGNNYTYPSCYDHVISVAATDAGNERAYFSNYGNKVDLSAPGVSIPSANRSGGYVRMSGTSMACPVAAGEAAVILSGNASLRGKTGKARVNALESLMKANAQGVGSGMGAGITILSKALKVSTAVTKPATPTIQFTPDNAAAAQTVKVTIQVQGEGTIYYTTDGKTPTYKNGLAGNGAVQYTKQFEIKNLAKATVKAIAVNENGVAGAVRSASYTLKPYVSSIAISGIQQIARGKSAQLQAAVLPAYATNKKVTWELYYRPDGQKNDVLIDAQLAKELGVSISTGGKVTASKNARTGSYTVKATAKDASGKSATYPIGVIETVKIDSVRFTDKNATLKSVTLVRPTEISYDLGQRLEVKCKEGMSADPSDFKWSSSNTAVATVNTSGSVMLLKAGKATITALADDSSGKKAACTITVKQLVTGITISGNAKVAAGKSATYKTAVTPSYATNKKVTWELYYTYIPDGEKNAVKAKVDAKIAKELGVNISPTSGKLTTTAAAKPDTYTVTAVAADDGKVVGSKSVVVGQGIITGITFDDSAYKKVSIFRKQQVTSTPTSATVSASVQGTNGADLTACEVLNSNPGIATVSAKQSKEKITLTIKATGKAAGKTNITIAANDGSGKKLTCAVTVNNPPSNIMVAPSSGNSPCVAKGKSLQLKAVVEAGNGKVASKSVIWELYTADNKKIDAETDAKLAEEVSVSISAGGKVTALKKAKAGKYTVKATAKDGSGVIREYSISVADPTTQIRLYDKNGKYLPTSYRYVIGRKKYLIGIESDIQKGLKISVSSSNPSVLSASTESGYLEMAAGKKGSATLTLKAMDGSGKQVKYYFIVR